MSALKQLARCVAALLRDDPRRCLLGEDVRNGGLLGLSRAAIEREELRARVFGSPLTSSAQLAHAGGLALAGQRPIVLLPSASALLEGLAALRELGRLGWRSQGASAAPILFVAPNGPGFGLGGEAAESTEASLAAVPGIELWTVGRARDLVATLERAAEFDDDDPRAHRPRVLLLPRQVVIHELIAELDELDEAEPGPTRIVRDGTRATVFAWGESVEPALAAAEACAAQLEDVEVQVVELARLAPLDLPRLVELANRTGKLVIAHAGSGRGGPGAELAASFADQSILHLDAPVLRVTGELGEGGLVAGDDEHRAVPSASAIAEAITHVVHY